MQSSLKGVREGEKLESRMEPVQQQALAIAEINCQNFKIFKKINKKICCVLSSPLPFYSCK